jgi:serine/threonine-protein kinase
VAVKQPDSGARRDVDARMLARVQGALAGRYLVERRLGHGAMAIVFQARRIADDREVALKVMRPGIGYEEGTVERFRVEGSVMAELDHPHIVRTHARGEAGDILWFEMELVEGSCLATLLRHGPLPWRPAARLLADAAGALAYAHRRGVIHRDIKPANMLIAEPSNRLKIADFGIARIVGSERLTATGLAVGTPSYMAPEQLISADVRPAIDQYALGIVAYEMLTGRAPPAAVSASADALMRRIRRRKSITASAPGCPVAIDEMVRRMLAFDPADRWPDLDAVATAAAGLAESPTPVPGRWHAVGAAIRSFIQ